MEQLTGARCDDAALELNPSRILSSDTLNTGHILAGILPAARHIDNNQTTTMQIAAERSRLFSATWNKTYYISQERLPNTFICFKCLFYVFICLF